MRVHKAAAAFVLLWLAGLALTYLAHAMLPERYYFDAQLIDGLIADPLLEWDDSFQRVALMYRWLGMGAPSRAALVPAVGYSVALGAIAFGARLARADWDPATYLVIALWCIPVAIYHGQYSKELYGIVVVAAVLWLARSAAGVAMAVLVGLAYAVAFRSYWAVIVALWLVLLAGWRGGLGWPLRLLLAGVAILVLSEASQELVGYRLSDGRTLTVENRDLDPDSATAFNNPFENTSSGTDIANTVLCWLALVLPFYLFVLGAIHHVLFALFQLLNAVLFVLVARRAVAPRGGVVAAESWRYAAAVTWCVAFTIVQGMFEPDFGSFAKHETNLVPMLAYLYLSARRRTQAAVEAATPR